MNALLKFETKTDFDTKKLGHWMNGWVGGWKDGWMDVKAGLRIGYSNQKLGLHVFIAVSAKDSLLNQNRIPGAVARRSPN